MKIGIIGLGRWGNNIFSSLLKNEIVEDIVVTSKPNTQFFGNKRVYIKSYRKNPHIFFKNLDAVIVSSPPETFINILEQCKKYKLPALFEKPLTTSTKFLENTVGDDYFNKFIDVDYIYLYSNLWNLFLKNVSLDFSKNIFLEFWSGNNGPARNNINIFWDWLPHDISMLFSITNIFDFNVKNITLINDQKGQYYQINLKKSNIDVVINVSNKMNYKMRFCKIINNKRSMIFDDVLKKAQIDDQYLKFDEHFSNLDPLDNLLNNFTHKLKSKKFIPDRTLNFSLRLNKMIEKIEIYWQEMNYLK